MTGDKPKPSMSMFASVADYEAALAKKKIGRPLNQEFQRTKIRTVRLTDADFAKLKELGTDRLRAWLRKAKPSPR